MQILGSAGRIEIAVPFTAPNDRPCGVLVNGEPLELPVCDQYTMQADLFSRAIRERSGAPYPLEDAAKNLAVREALFRSASSGRWEAPEGLDAFSR